MVGLHQLALQLTGEPAHAIGCVAAAMAECIDGPAVKARYGEHWARRAVAKNAIASALGPGPWLADRWWDIADLEADHEVYGNRGNSADLELLAGLDALERIVNVLCRVEGYSVHECASLIGIAAKEIGDVQPAAADASAAPAVAA